MKSPLAIFVLWHHLYADGEQYANRIFSDFKRNANDPLSRGMNIPVFFRSHQATLIDIPETYERAIVVALVDSKFAGDTRYRDYFSAIDQSPRNDIHLIPVALFEPALYAGLTTRNFVRLFQKENKNDYLTGILAHEFARHLYDLPEKRLKDTDPAALRLFISHAKVDGLDIAKRIKSFVQEEYPLDVFFDANNITVGYEFDKVIERNITNAVVIAIHTDKYASREWCRREILLAKRNNRPIVTVNCLKDGESRSFPYMANVLTVHFLPMDETVWFRLMAAVMKETLRLKYQEVWIEYILSLRNDDGQDAMCCSYPPELVTVLYVDKKKNRFIYPDPPLSGEELSVLKMLERAITYVTPSDL